MSGPPHWIAYNNNIADNDSVDDNDNDEENVDENGQIYNDGQLPINDPNFIANANINNPNFNANDADDDDDDIPPLVALGPHLPAHNMHAWWSALPDLLVNLYMDQYALVAMAPGEATHEVFSLLMSLVVAKHSNPNLDQNHWLEFFQELEHNCQNSPDEVKHRLYQYRFTYEQVLDWIGTRTNDEMDVIRPLIEADY